jgi:hypothetical protein
MLVSCVEQEKEIGQPIAVEASTVIIPEATVAEEQRVDYEDKKPEDSQLVILEQNTPPVIIYVLPVEDPMERAEEKIIKNSDYWRYHFEFEKLLENEIIVFTTGDYIIDGRKTYGLQVSAKIEESNKERVIGYWNSTYGMQQISADRRSGVFFIYGSLFKIDGNAGMVQYLMDISRGARTTPDLQYLLYDMSHLIDFTKQPFVLVNLETQKIIRIIEWNRAVDVDSGGGFRIFRSLDPEYDFRIDYGIESETYGTAYYSIGRDELNVVFDIPWTSWEEAKPQRKIEPEELGR